MGGVCPGSLRWSGARLPLSALRLPREQQRAQRATPAARLLALRLRLLVRAARGLLREPQDGADRLRQGAARAGRRPLRLRGHRIRRGRADRAGRHGACSGSAASPTATRSRAASSGACASSTSPCTYRFNGSPDEIAGDGRLLPRLRRRRRAARGAHPEDGGAVPVVSPRHRSATGGADGAAAAGRDGPRALGDRARHLGVRRAMGRGRRRGLAGGVPRGARRGRQLDRHGRHLRPGARRADRRQGRARAPRRGDRGHQGRRRLGDRPAAPHLARGLGRVPDDVVRPQPAGARPRPHRPLPGPLAGGRRAGGGDDRRAARAARRGQDPGDRRLELPPRRPRGGGRRGARSTRTSPATT